METSICVVRDLLLCILEGQDWEETRASTLMWSESGLKPRMVCFREAKESQANLLLEDAWGRGS